MSKDTFIQKLENIINTTHKNPFVNISKAEQEQIIPSHTQEAYTSIRINPRKVDTTMYQQLEEVKWCDGAYYLPERPVFTLDPKFHGGAYYVQEASSMFLQHVIKHLQNVVPSSAKRYLDLCAAPGGKSTLLASIIDEADLLVSNEVIQTRAQILVENAIKWGHINHWVVNNDPKDFEPIGAFFDVAVIDAPCTGSGLWRKDEASIDEWSAEHVQLCSDRQKRIVADILPVIKPGGYIVYATCSYSPEEDEALCDFMTSSLGLKNVPIPVDESWNIHVTHSEVHQAEGYHFYPWRLKGEGFYLAVFQKEVADEESISFSKKDKKKGKKDQKQKVPKAAYEPWANLIDDAYDLRIIQDVVYAFEREQWADFELLKQHLYIKKAGVRLGTVTPKEVIPEHELALSTIIKMSVPKVTVTKENALLYLKKESILADAGLKGWHIVNYEGVNLGWGKWMPNRMNNYMPKNWRIRMDVN